MAKVRARTRHYNERLVSEAEHWVKIENEITRLWERRGVKWSELDYNELMAKRKIMTYGEWKENNARV